jgi:hypothetical protein
MYRYRQIIEKNWCSDSEKFRQRKIQFVVLSRIIMKGLTKVEHFQQLEKWNKFLQWRMNVKKIISLPIFFGEI